MCGDFTRSAHTFHLLGNLDHFTVLQWPNSWSVNSLPLKVTNYSVSERVKIFISSSILQNSFLIDYTEFLGLPKGSGMLKDVSRFDASYFGMLPKQVNKTDPQLRILLEVAYEAIVDAGKETTLF